MADLFHKQAAEYAKARLTYPPELFDFIASKTANHTLAWDVGTGNGQAVVPLSQIFKNVVGTDSSKEQLALAPKLPNVSYHHFPCTISVEDLQLHIASQATVDLITVAQAMHWFDLPAFYDIVNFSLRRPGGVIAVWCYALPRINDRFDALLDRYYEESAGPFWEVQRKLVDDEYRTIEFPFDPVDGMDDTGPVEFVAERPMDFGMYMTYLRSWSSYQTAKDKGVELLTDEVIAEFEDAWGGDGQVVKIAKSPIFLRIGEVRD